MSENKIKVCQRCQNSFECRMNDIATCQCSTVTIDQATHDFLAKTNFDCLCKNCLVHFNKLVLECQPLTFPNNPRMLENGLHYYMDGGYFVFTEQYHLLRGNCCKSGCRHCAYGFDS